MKRSHRCDRGRIALALALLLGLLTGGYALPNHPPARPAHAPSPPPVAAIDDTVPFSATRKDGDILRAGQEVEILNHAGRGCLTYMWFAMDERVRVRVYVDGETTPSIDMATDLGHGYAFGGPRVPFGSPVMGRYGAQFNTYRIPYGTRVRVTLSPMTTVFNGPTGRRVWYTIRGLDNMPPLVIGGLTLPRNARLKLYRLEPYEAKPLEEFDLCNVKGSGMLYMVTIAAQGLRKSGNEITDLSYMEGCVRAYLNGSSEPQYLSSGLEDYFLGSGYFYHNTLYFGSVAGLTYLNKAEREFSAYRFHDADLVTFHNGLRLTLRDGDRANGYVVLDPPPARYSTYVWLYQW